MSNKLDKIVSELNDTYAYIKSLAKYYWIEKGKYFNPKDVASNLMCNNIDLYKLRKSGIIKDYDDMCYLKGGRKNCLNLLNEDDILPISKNANKNQYIDELINNVCGNKAENIEYLHKAILYKHHNINDYTIPAIVFYGAGGSGKGSFITLLSTIFGENNVLSNLGQRDISGSFDTYKGQKLIVEFAEISTNNTSSDMKILNKLKNIIGAERITVNEKGIPQYQIENIAWFFISSNSNKPLQLDDKDKGNRRFTIIKSLTPLKNGEEINIMV